MLSDGQADGIRIEGGGKEGIRAGSPKRQRVGHTPFHKTFRWDISWKILAIVLLGLAGTAWGIQTWKSRTEDKERRGQQEQILSQKLETLKADLTRTVSEERLNGKPHMTITSGWIGAQEQGTQSERMETTDMGSRHEAGVEPQAVVRTTQSRDYRCWLHKEWTNPLGWKKEAMELATHIKDTYDKDTVLDEIVEGTRDGQKTFILRKIGGQGVVFAFAKTTTWNRTMRVFCVALDTAWS